MTLRPIEPAHLLKSILLLGTVCTCLTIAPAARAQAAPTGTLTVTFEGVKTRTGAVMLSLAGSPEAYDDKAPPAGQAMVPATGATVTATFTGLAPGRYAIKAFHDVNGDGKMGANPFGMPTEPFAFSNNAHGVMGPAKWPDASFELKAGANAQTISID